MTGRALTAIALRDAEVTLPWRLRTEWVVLRGIDGARVPVDARIWATMHDPPLGLGGGRLVWSDLRDRCLVAAWQADEPLRGPPWYVDENGVTIVRGQLRRRGEPWTQPARWSRDLVRDQRQDGTETTPVEGLVGDGTVVVLRSDGSGVVAADSAGLARVHRAKGDDFEVLASSSTLAAEAAGAGRQGPRRDPLAPAWLCYAGFLVGPDTGYEGVRTLPVGSRAVIGPAGPILVEGADPWLDPNGLVDASEDEVLDHIAAAVIDQVEAARTIGPTPQLDLTGGKDSRLLLALALSGRTRHELEARTVGPPDLPDVIMAARLAAHLGISHRSGMPLRPGRAAYRERASRFVEQTDGSRTLWSMSLREGVPGDVRISGTMGEELRVGRIEEAWHRASEGKLPESPEAVVDFLARRYRGGAASFLLPDVLDELHGRLAVELLDGPTDRPADMLGNYFVRHRGARYGGPLLDQDDDHRIFALFSVESLRGAYTLGPLARRHELIHHHLTARYSEELAQFEFDGPSWAGGYVAHPAPLPVLETAPASRTETATEQFPTASPPAGGRRKPQGLIVSLTSQPNQERQEFLDSIAADSSNPLWDVADRSQVRQAVQNLDNLPSKDRTRLYALATGGLWLAP